MKKNHEKEKKKRILAMNYKQRVFMAKVLEGLKKKPEIGTLSKAAEILGTNQANARRALLRPGKGTVAHKLRADLLEMAGIKPKTLKTTTGEKSCQTN